MPGEAPAGGLNRRPPDPLRVPAALASYWQGREVRPQGPAVVKGGGWRRECPFPPEADRWALPPYDPPERNRHSHAGCTMA